MSSTYVIFPAQLLPHQFHKEKPIYRRPLGDVPHINEWNHSALTQLRITSALKSGARLLVGSLRNYLGTEQKRHGLFGGSPVFAIWDFKSAGWIMKQEPRSRAQRSPPRILGACWWNVTTASNFFLHNILFKNRLEFHRKSTHLGDNARPLW